MAILNLDGLKRVVENIKSHFSDINHVHETLDVGDVGSGTKPIYMSNGAPTASSSTVGSGTKPIYLNSGTLTASGSTVGSSTRPVYLNAGTVTQTGTSLAVDVTGNAATATKLANARTVRTYLESTSTASFDGSANITPGVTGILPVANGGTGSSTEKYLPLSGGTISGDLTVTGSLSAAGSSSATVTVRHYTASVSAKDTVSFSYDSGSSNLNLSGDTAIYVGCYSGCATTCVSGCSSACVTDCGGGCTGCTGCDGGCNSDEP